MSSTSYGSNISHREDSKVSEHVPHVSGEATVPHYEHEHTHEQKEHEKRIEKHLQREADHTDRIAEQAAELQHEAEAKAQSAEDVRRQIQSEQRPIHHQPALASAELKKLAGERTLTSIRKHLSVPERTMSKIVHQPVVEGLSEVGSKTVARPSGILVGGILASLGNAVVLYICRHYGYTYNFFLFAIFFAGGFALGLLIELMWRLIHRPTAE
jgi:hypothetical protein